MSDEVPPGAAPPAADEKKIRDGCETWITDEHLAKTLQYLHADRAAYGPRWSLDAGKLARALSLAGVGVRTDAAARLKALQIQTAADGLRAALSNADDILECNCGGGCSGTCTKAWLAREGGANATLLDRLAETNDPEVPAAAGAGIHPPAEDEDDDDSAQPAP